MMDEEQKQWIKTLIVDSKEAGKMKSDFELTGIVNTVRIKYNCDMVEAIDMCQEAMEEMKVIKAGKDLKTFMIIFGILGILCIVAVFSLVHGLVKFMACMEVLNNVWRCL